MFDITYVRKSLDLKKKILGGEDIPGLFEQLENLRSKEARVFQLETTNACNMTCVFCPRTEHMNRHISHIEMADFKAIIDQINQFSEAEESEWDKYVEDYGMKNSIAEEEDFFYYVICSKTVILHGFGDPLLDNELAERIEYCVSKNLKTYFSTNPVNINMNVMENLGKAGLSYIKFHLDGVDNPSQLYYRGRIDKSYEETKDKINATVELFKKKLYPTKVILTKLKFNNNDNLDDEFLDYWKDKGVMVYIKNQHNRWLYEEENAVTNNAEYMSRYCEFPWSSLSVLKGGEVVPCPLEFNGELVMGNIKDGTLNEIWNGDKYTELRKMHITGKFPDNHFCTNKCDFHKVHEILQ